MVKSGWELKFTKLSGKLDQSFNWSWPAKYLIHVDFTNSSQETFTSRFPFHGGQTSDEK